MQASKSIPGHVILSFQHGLCCAGDHGNIDTKPWRKETMENDAKTFVGATVPTVLISVVCQHTTVKKTERRNSMHWDSKWFQPKTRSPQALKASQSSKTFKIFQDRSAIFEPLGLITVIAAESFGRFESERDRYATPLKPLATCCICQVYIVQCNSDRLQKTIKILHHKGTSNGYAAARNSTTDYLNVTTTYSLNSLTIWLIWPLIPVIYWLCICGIDHWLNPGPRSFQTCPAMAEASAPLLGSSPKSLVKSRQQGAPIQNTVKKSTTFKIHRNTYIIFLLSKGIQQAGNGQFLYIPGRLLPRTHASFILHYLHQVHRETWHACFRRSPNDVIIQHNYSASANVEHNTPPVGPQCGGKIKK